MKNPVTSDKYHAVLFDLDGVLTSTEKIHAACWKKMFDEYLKSCSSESNAEFVPFDINGDYLNYVDGKPRYEGVRDFLESRGISLPFGRKEDPPEEKTICGLGNRKNMFFNEMIKNGTVEIYKSSIDMVKNLINNNFNVAVVSSSRNCRTILKAAGIDGYFRVVVDGIEAEKAGLRGKPMPDTYLYAAKQLSSKPEKTVVVEDAVSGVQAGKNGKFGLVIGIARKNNNKELQKNGADLVVKDLKEIEILKHNSNT